MAFLLAMFKWSKDFENFETYGECFKYVLFLMNDVCIFGEMQSESANKALLEAVDGDIQILQFVGDCYWIIVVFSLAHEVAHAYLASIGKKYSDNHPEREEYDADMIAYHIVLKIMIEEQGESAILEEYTYLAPMMYMDFFDLYYYTDRVLYKTVFYDPEHPTPIKRKNRLFAIAYKKDYDFESEDGNHLYGGFLDVYDEYRNQLLLKMERRKLDTILHIEEREQIRRNGDESAVLGDFVALALDAVHGIISGQNPELLKYQFVILNLMCIKHRSWQQENEFRILFPNPKLKEDGKRLGLRDIGLEISAIYLGKNCSNRNKKKLKEIASNLHADIYQMRVDNQSRKFDMCFEILK